MLGHTRVGGDACPGACPRDTAGPRNVGPRQHPFFPLDQRMEAQAGTLTAGGWKQPQTPGAVDGTPAHAADPSAGVRRSCGKAVGAVQKRSLK